jgi:hypothetical protein
MDGLEGTKIISQTEFLFHRAFYLIWVVMT